MSKYLFASLLLAATSLIQVWAQTPCQDRYRVTYTVQPAGQRLWLSPDEPLQLEVPGKNEAVLGPITLSLALKRASASHLTAQFTMSALRPGQSAPEALQQSETLVVSIAMEQDRPAAYAGHIQHADTGSVWGIALTPVCRAA